MGRAAREDMSSRLPVLLITGPVGVGKTTVAEAVSELLTQDQVPHALLDVDELSRFWPAPADDPFNFELVLKNTAAVCRTFSEAGARCLVLAYVIERAADRARFASVIPYGELRVIRLHARLETLRGRITARESAATESLDWHLRRAPELAEIMERNAIGDRVVATDGRSAADIAHEILAGEAWYRELVTRRSGDGRC